MPVRGINHAVLWVRDADASARFYTEVLGFGVVGESGEAPRKAIFLRAPESDNDHDLGLFGIGAEAAETRAGRGETGLYHIAWEVPTLHDLRAVAERLAERGALVGATDHGTTKGVYAKDVDGLEFEVCWLVPHELIDDEARARRGPLDIDAEIARFGATTEGACARSARGASPAPSAG
ncbi:Catechol-2,3-dioxygenase [Streptomyces sp. ADI96-02]|uniref:VOC family protein n=1 Tax=Streptomyces sp. ADI96-02 TaxID=1522760 RepID=UPI000F558447|nr:VOC family protein [Streptomyces sp. ADI96-02]RPK54571.1 Catechol-2,3-dioxygenase [Streptomyces sp. ADI96-02]